MTAAIPFVAPARVTLKQGGGGRAMRALVERLFIKDFAAMPFDGIGLAAMDDGAAIPLANGEWLIVTTDSHVIHPIFFPGGDIGRIAVAGTVNDLTMMGATRILGLTCGVILEEGFPLEQLEAIQRSIVETCREAGTVVITGDTKVMGRGEIDGIVINTSGVAVVLEERRVPITDAVRAAGEVLGIDPLHVANEGKAVMGVRAEFAEQLVDVLHRHRLGVDAAIIGTCIAERPGSVVLDTGFGKRLLAEPDGEPLPRIC